MEGSKGFRGKAHLLQFGICMFCLFTCKWMQNSEVMELFYVFFNTLRVLCALTVVDLVVLLCHSSYNLTIVRDFIFQRLSFVIYELWQGQSRFYDMVVIWRYCKRVPCDKDNKATKSQVILIEGLEVVFFFLL